MAEESDDTGDKGGDRRSRLARLGRKLLDRGDDVKELASAVLETSDRAKTEMVRMVAREVRNYLDELKLKDDLHELVTSHSLELHISMSLKPLGDKKEAAASSDEALPPEPDEAVGEE